MVQTLKTKGKTLQLGEYCPSTRKRLESKRRKQERKKRKEGKEKKKHTHRNIDYLNS